MAIMSTMQKRITRRFCIFGPPKSGKTRLFGQLAELGFRLHFLDLESGSNTLFDLSEEAKSRVNLIKIPDTVSNPCAANILASLVKFRGKVSFCEIHGNVNCIACKKEGLELTTIDLATFTNKDFLIVDSMTKLQSSVMALRIAQTGRPFDVKPEWDDYAIQGKTMEYILSFFEQVHFNFGITSHELEVDLEDGSKKLVPIAGSSNYSRTSGKFFDDVIYLRVEGQKYKAYSCATTNPKIACGTRSDVVLEKLPEITIEPFVRALLEQPEQGLSATNASSLGTENKAADAISNLEQAKAKVGTTIPQNLSIGSLKLGKGVGK